MTLPTPARCSPPRPPTPFPIRRPDQAAEMRCAGPRASRTVTAVTQVLRPIDAASAGIRWVRGADQLRHDVSPLTAPFELWSQFCTIARRDDMMDLPHALIDQVQAGHVALVLGAGASIGAVHPHCLKAPQAASVFAV